MRFILFALIFLIVQFALAGPTPDPLLTPGKVRAATKEELCKIGSTKDARHVTQAMKNEVFRRYGMVKGTFKPGDYEIDHFISLELGGANDIENLWPQLYSGEFGARKKDVIETHFHREICKGRMTLEDAQARIKADWTKEYTVWRAAHPKR